MNRRTLTGTMAALSLGLALCAAAPPTFAAGRAHGVAGKITQVSASSLQVQTSSGSVTEQLTSGTRVLKVTKGSLSDLTPGIFVQVTLAADGATVTAIHLEARGSAASHPHSGTRPARNGSTGSGTAKPKSGLHRGGQIVSAANGQLILRNQQGQTATYRLGATVTVTKTVAGQLSDLAVGETVEVRARPGSTTAVEVTIESA